MSHYDIVAMGAGHSGLVAAAYLAKAGKGNPMAARAARCVSSACSSMTA